MTALGPGVSREAAKQLRDYWALLRRWNTTVQLIAPRSIEGGWQRHIADSIQLVDRFPTRAVRHCDLGSGGGLPAIPIGLHRHDLGFEDGLTMIEADRRKSAFLRTACRELGLSASIVAERVERADSLKADVVTARALAPLDRLFGYVVRHLLPSGCAILPKGRGAEQEIALARRRWAFDLDRCPSGTAPDASILVISNLKRLEDGDVA